MFKKNSDARLHELASTVLAYSSAKKTSTILVLFTAAFPFLHKTQCTRKYGSVFCTFMKTLPKKRNFQLIYMGRSESHAAAFGFPHLTEAAPAEHLRFLSGTTYHASWLPNRAPRQFQEHDIDGMKKKRFILSLCQN
jgi:hypothetical protein